MILTKWDVGRRFGGALAAADAADLAFSQISATPFIGGGMSPATPLRLARLILDQTDEDDGVGLSDPASDQGGAS